MTSTFGSYISNISHTTKWIVLAALIQVLDSLTFLLAYGKYGFNGEISPFAYGMHQIGGLPLIMTVKLVGVLVAVGVLFWMKRREEEWAFRGAWYVALFGLAGMIINTLAIMV